MHDFLYYLKHVVLSKEIDAQRRLSAYILGCGLPGLAAGYLLVSETFVPGHHVHFLERKSLPGGKYSDKSKKHDTLVMPFVRYLQGQDVRFHYDARVTNIIFGAENGVRMASRIEIEDNGRPCAIDLTDSDMVISTIGTPVDAANFVTVRSLPVMLRDRLLVKCREEVAT